MPKTVRLYPYHVSPALELRLSDPFDPEQTDLNWGSLQTSEDAESEETRYDVSEVQWRSMSLKLSAMLPVDELKEILPAGSDPERDTSMIVSVRCARTKLRKRIRLIQGANGTWKGDLMVRRPDVRSVIHLIPLVVRQTDIPDSAEDETDEKARYSGAIIAEGRRIALVVDPPEQPRDESVHVRWDDFRNSTDDWRKQHPSDLFHFEPYLEEPVLWLNARYTALQAALNSQAKHGTEAVLRDLTGALLANTVWTHLFVTAMGMYQEADLADVVELPETGWKRQVLENFLPRLYPELDGDERLKRAVADYNDPEGIGTLMSRVGNAAQGAISLYKFVESSVRAAERTRDGRKEEG